MLNSGSTPGHVTPLSRGFPCSYSWVVLVERCWVCLEQPAVTTVPGADGRACPVCDICAIEHPRGPAIDRPITDDDLRRIVGDLSA